MAVNEADVVHFLGRIGFAPSDEEIAVFVGREIPDIVDQVLRANANPPNTPGYLGNRDDGEWFNNVRNIDWWLNRMRLSRWNDRNGSVPSPLVEKMTLFWHGHFASAFEKVHDANLMFEQNQMFREHALGDFETMCREVSLHGAMLIYLDNETNVAGAVQENFARELMELFTMGIGNYTETDVVEMARAWTGHGTVGWLHDEERYDGTYEYHPDEHDNGQKTIFGIQDNWDAADTITEICRGVRQTETARFITTKLWRWFVHAAPPESAVNDIASAFVSSGCSIRELMRALLSHPEFWQPSTRGALVKTPTQYVVDFNRRTGVPFTGENMQWYMRPMGQTLFDPPNVAGWGTNGYWLSTATMWGRSQYATNQRWQLNTAGFLDGISAMTPNAGTDYLLEKFGIRTPSAVTREAVRKWFLTTQNSDPWALSPVGVSVATLCPDFQVI